MDGAPASSSLCPTFTGARVDRSVSLRCRGCVEGEEVAVRAVLRGGRGAGCGVCGGFAVEDVVGGLLHFFNGHVTGIGQLGFGCLNE